jgi:hypothetical protein
VSFPGCDARIRVELKKLIKTYSYKNIGAIILAGEIARQNNGIAC